MFWITIREIPRRRGWLQGSPLLFVIKVLSTAKLGSIRDLQSKLRHLPASFGPIPEEDVASMIMEDLKNLGAVVEMSETLN